MFWVLHERPTPGIRELRCSLRVQLEKSPYNAHWPPRRVRLFKLKTFIAALIEAAPFQNGFANCIFPRAVKRCATPKLRHPKIDSASEGFRIGGQQILLALTPRRNDNERQSYRVLVPRLGRLRPLFYLGSRW